MLIERVFPKVIGGSATVFLSLLLLVGSAVSVHAQGSEWKTLNDEVKPLYQKGQYDRAVVVAKGHSKPPRKPLAPTILLWPRA